jgi:hypothetical protein
VDLRQPDGATGLARYLLLPMDQWSGPSIRCEPIEIGGTNTHTQPVRCLPATATAIRGLPCFPHTAAMQRPRVTRQRQNRCIIEIPVVPKLTKIGVAVIEAGTGQLGSGADRFQ